MCDSIVESCYWGNPSPKLSSMYKDEDEVTFSHFAMILEWNFNLKPIPHITWHLYNNFVETCIKHVI